MDQSTDKPNEQAITFIMDRYEAHIANKYDLSSQGKSELINIEANFRICEKDLDYEKHPGLFSFRKTAATLLGI
jgi:hypothetical protein